MTPANTLQPLAIYVHWPWCKAKCPYCDFNSHAGSISEDKYIAGILNEFSQWRDGQLISPSKTHPFNPAFRQIESVFFGGGTPSLMKVKSIEQILEGASKMGRLDASTEITVECNPTSFDSPYKALSYFEDLKAAGVNRISVGIQGLQAEWLIFLGRNHKVEEALTTLDAAQTIFENVNADVIYGLPNQQLSAWNEQLKLLSERDLSHISAYQLTIEKNTRFYSDVRRGAWTPISDDAEADFFEETRLLLTSHGYENYEISNFSKPYKACRHNTHVWKYGEYLGIGAGAHGRIALDDGSLVATQVTRQPEGYLERLATSRNPLSSVLLLNAHEAAQEAIFSGLRLAEGIDMELLAKRLKISLYQHALSEPDVTMLLQEGLLEVHLTHLRLTYNGWAKLNGVLSRILRPLNETFQAIELPAPNPTTVYLKPKTVFIQ